MSLDVSQDEDVGGQTRWDLKRVLVWIGIAAVAYGVASMLRHLVIEPQAAGMACSVADAPWWCMPRQTLLFMHIDYRWGQIGLACGVISLLFYWRPAVFVGFVFSVMGLVLYNADLAGIGLVLTCLALPRVARTRHETQP